MATLAPDLLDRRVLAAVCFVDTLGAPVLSPLLISAAPGTRWFVKRAGTIIVTQAPGLDDYAASFDAIPAAPAVGSVAVTFDVKPLARAYAPRRFTLALPRAADPKTANSVFAPVTVILPPTAASPLAGLAAGVRATVTRKDDGRAIEGALVRLKPSDGRSPVLSLTDAAGEALLMADAIPLASPGPGAVMVRDVAATLDAVVDPAQARFHTPAEIAAARRDAGARRSGFIDPDTLAGTATPAQTVRIAAGLAVTAAIQWAPP